MRVPFRLFILIALTFLMNTPVYAKRIALVIGNDAYEHISPTQKAVNDAKAISNSLKKIGFQVQQLLNSSHKETTDKIKELSLSITPIDEVLFFFAGHGISVDGKNYILPVDVSLGDEGKLSLLKNAFSIRDILNKLSQAKPKIVIAIIDADRSDPFKVGGNSEHKSLRDPYSSKPLPQNSFLLYSTGVGQNAVEGLSANDKNPNSVFTRHLQQLIQKPGLSIVKLARLLRDTVRKLTDSIGHIQTPAYYDQLFDDYYLVKNKK